MLLILTGVFMKNLQRLLIAAAFAYIMPSIIVCSEEPTKTIALESATPTATSIWDIDPLKTALMVTVSIQSGLFGFIAGAQGSHSLKKIKRHLTKATEQKAYSSTEETILKQLNKGIRNNRIGMAASLALVASPFAIIKLNDMKNANQAQVYQNDLSQEMIRNNEQFLSSSIVKELQEKDVNNVIKGMQASTDEIASNLTKKLRTYP
jgi:hypothetical protein